VNTGEDPLQKHLEIPSWGGTKYEIISVGGDTVYQVNKPRDNLFRVLLQA
jgi:hypothetical protein